MQIGFGRACPGYGAVRRFVNRPGLSAFVFVFALLLAPASAAPRILALGDSLTAGFGLAPEDGFTSRLAARLKADGVAVDIINGGVSGDTSAGGLARLDWAMADHPDVVLLELGANDALRGIDPRVTYANLDRILAKLEAAGVRVLLIGMRAPANWGRAYEQEFNAIYPKLAAKYGVMLYPFLLDGVALDPKLNQPDGLHPNAQGVEVIVDRLAPYVARLLGAAGAQKG